MMPFLPSFFIAGLWLSILLVKPSVASNTRVSLTLNLLSAMMFFLYVTEDPDLTSNRRYNDKIPGVSGKTVGAIFLVGMAMVYLWMNWMLAAKCP